MPLGCVRPCGGSTAVWDPCGGSPLGVLGVCTRAVQMCVICTVVHLGNLWLCVGYMDMFWGNAYLCKSGFLVDVQMCAEKHYLIRGPQMRGPEPFVSAT